jgi:hypothetical protein
MDLTSLVIFLGILYSLTIIAIFIAFIRILQLLEGELFNQEQNSISEQRENTETLITQTPDVFFGGP